MSWLIPMLGGLMFTVTVMYSASPLANLVIHLVNSLREHWVWYLSAVTSALVGFGTTWWLSTRVKERNIRYRSGPNIRKKFMRSLKKKAGWRRSPDNSPSPERSGPTEVRTSVDDKFNRIGRKRWCYHGPTQASLHDRMNLLERKVQQTKIGEDRTKIG